MSNPYASPEQDSHAQPSASFVQYIRGLQIIIGALAMGAILITAVMLVIGGGELNGELDIVAAIGLGFAGLIFVLHLVIPPFIVRNQMATLNRESIAALSHDETNNRIFGALRSGHIVGCAMLEGAAVMNAVLYQITKFGGNLAAASILIVILVTKMPSTFGMQNKVTDRLREIELR